MIFRHKARDPNVQKVPKPISLRNLIYFTKATNKAPLLLLKTLKYK